MSRPFRDHSKKIPIDSFCSPSVLCECCFEMPGLPNRTTVVPPPNVTMAYHQAGPVMQPGVWNSNSNYGNGSNCNSWANSVQTPSATVHPVRQTFDVIARRRNPHYWTAGNSNNPAVSSPGSGNSPLTPTPTPSPATPSPISPAYPNRPVSVDDAIHREPFFLNTDQQFNS